MTASKDINNHLMADRKISKGVTVTLL